jgi:general secretion pathway protein C
MLCASIALAAYLQASGIGQLVAATIADTPPATPDAASPAGPAPNRHKDGNAILARNPFDSVTGPLDGKSEPIPEAPPPPTDAGPGTDEDPACDFGRVVLISAADDPEWSFAAIQLGSGGSKLRRKGDDVQGHTVQAMTWDRVWLTSSGKRCQMKLGDKKEMPKSAAKAPAGATDPKGSRRGGRDLDPAMAAKISKVSETEYNIERSLVDEILENQAELMRQARIVPEKEGDEVVGIRLFGIRSGSLLGHLGLQNGDRLESINGFSMSDPQKALEAYGRLRTANNLKVQVNRKGTPVTIDFNIQ